MFGGDFETVFDKAGGVARLTADFAFGADAVPVRGAPANGALLRRFVPVDPAFEWGMRHQESMFRVAVCRTTQRDVAKVSNLAVARLMHCPGGVSAVRMYRELEMIAAPSGVFIR